MAMWSVTQTSAIAGAASAARAQASTVSRVDCGPMLRSTMPTRRRRPSRCAPPLSMVERTWMTSPAHAPAEPLPRPRAVRAAAPPRRSHVGTISLLAAVAGVVVTRVVLSTTSLADAGWLHVVAAGFEAAVVGALADWFAVTALFRHPLGIPIPHTAIIPAQKLRLGRALGRFVANHVFTPEEVARTLGRLDLPGILHRFLSDPEAARPAAQALAGL